LIFLTPAAGAAVEAGADEGGAEVDGLGAAEEAGAGAAEVAGAGAAEVAGALVVAAGVGLAVLHPLRTRVLITTRAARITRNLFT